MSRLMRMFFLSHNINQMSEHDCGKKFLFFLLIFVHPHLIKGENY